MVGGMYKRKAVKRPSAHFGKKDDAIDRGRELAKKGDLGQLKIKKQDGTFQKEYTYGDDPPEG